MFLHQDYRTQHPTAASSFFSSIGSSFERDDSDEEARKTVEQISSTISIQGFHPALHIEEDLQEIFEKEHSIPNNKQAVSTSLTTFVTSVSNCLFIKEQSQDMADVPRSMEEIYKISNKNKKRNKEKRKLKENSKETVDQFSPVKFTDDSFDGNEVEQGKIIILSFERRYLT